MPIQKEEPDLYRRSIKGGYWVVATRIAVNILGFVKSLFIVNFFLLNDLGIISAALMMMEVLTTFTQTGFESALIQKKEDIHEYLDTVWTAGIIKGVILFLILYFAAPVLTMFRIPADKVLLAIWVFRAMGVCFLLQGLRNIGAIYFSKNLDFHKTFILSLASTMTDILLSIGLVLVFRNIWGVIAARLVSAVVSCAGTYVLSSYRPRLRFIPSKARDLWKFGKWIFGQNILGYLLENGDDFFVWFYLGINPLALYRTGFHFAITPATHISYVISEVSFPAYSKIQNDLPRLRDAYLKVLKITSLLSIPTAFLIFILGPDFVHLFMKPHLYPMIPVLQILAFKGLMGSLSATWPPLYGALGKPQKITHLMCIGIVILGLTIYPFTRMWGINGTSLATLSIGILASPYGYFLICKMLKCTFYTIVKPFRLPMISSMIMFFCIFLLKHYLFIEINYFNFSLLLIISIAVYLMCMWVFDGFFNNGIRELIVEQIRFLASFAKRA